jgi:hypothetical protein
MGARQKLNFAYFNGALLIAAIAGLALNSWPLFILSLAVGVLGGFHRGEIRATPRKR